MPERGLPLVVSGTIAAKIACLSPTGLYNAVRRGQIPATKIGRRLIISVDTLAQRLNVDPLRVQRLAAELMEAERA